MKLSGIRIGYRVFLLGAFAFFLVLYMTGMWRALFMESWEQEKLAVSTDVQRVSGMLAEQCEELNLLLLDWASWDDAYDFMQSGDNRFVRSNLTVDTFIDQQLSAVVFLDAHGELFWGRAYTDDFDEAPGLLQDVVRAVRKFLPENGSDVLRGGQVGYVSLNHGLFYLAIQKVLTSEGQGPFRGYAIMVRHFGEARRWTMKTRAQLPIVFMSPFDSGFIKEHSHVLSELSSGLTTYVERGTLNSINGYGLLRDLQNKPVTVYQVSRDRVLHRITMRGAVFGVGLFLLSAVVVFGGMFYFVERRLLNRVWNLRRQVRDVGEFRDVSDRIEVAGNDELAELATDMNDMLDSLDQARVISEERYLGCLARERYLENMLEALPLGMLAVDVETCIVVQANRRALDLLRSSRDAVLGQHCSSLFDVAHECRLVFERMVGTDEFSIMHGASSVRANTPYRMTVSRFEHDDGELYLLAIDAAS